MIKYYVAEIQKLSTSEKETSSVYSYGEKNMALGTFHSKLGSAMKSDIVESELLLVFDSEGSFYGVERYSAENDGEEIAHDTAG